MEELQWKEFSEGVSNEVVFNLIKLSVEKFNEGVNGIKINQPILIHRLESVSTRKGQIPTIR